MNNGWIHFITLHLALLMVCVAKAQENIQFVQAPNADLLSTEAVTAITMDKQGFLWIGTMSGLVKYDGITTRKIEYSFNDSTSLSNNFITSTFVDDSGRLWIGTRKGLNLYDHDTETFTRFIHNPVDSTSLSHNLVTGLDVDKHGRLLVSTYGGGLNIRVPGTNRFEHLRHRWYDENSNPSNIILTVQTDINGTIWMGTKFKGLVSYKNGKYKTIQHVPGNVNSPHSNYINDLMIDDNQHIWLIYKNHGLSRYNPEKRIFEHYFIDEKTNINKLVQQPEGTIWACTDNGLYYLNKNREFELHSGSLDEHTNQHISIGYAYVADNASFWILKNGLKKYIPGQKNFYQASRIRDKNYKPIHDVVNSVIQFNDKVIAGTKKGLCLLDKSTKTLVPLNTAGIPEEIEEIYLDKNTIWVIAGNTIRQYDRQWNLINHFDEKSISFLHSELNCLMNDYDKLWIGTGEGLVILDLRSGTWQLFKQDELLSNYITNLLKDKNGYIWIGTADGLHRFNAQDSSILTFKPDINDRGSISDKFISSIYEDSNGRLWVGTHSGGVNRYNSTTNTFKSYGKKDGFAHNTAHGILEDSNGQLWISSKGISRFDPKTGSIQNFEIIKGNKVNDVFPNSCMIDNDGTIYFGGGKGLIWFNPEDIDINHNTPEIILTGLKIFNNQVLPGDHYKVLNKPLDELKQLELNYNHDVINIEYVGLHYTAPDKVQYAYYLKGFEKNYNYVGQQQSATYTNLSPGTYTFMLKAANEDNIWSSTARTLAITVKPPFWSTWWFRIVASVTIIAGVVLMFMARVRNIRKQKVILKRLVREKTEEIVRQKDEILQKNKQLEEHQKEILIQARRLHEMDQMKIRFFTNISHEFRTPLTLILGPLEKLMHSINKSSLNKQYNLMHRNAKRLLRLINELLDVSKLESGKMKINYQQCDIVEEAQTIINSFREFADEQQINLIYHTNCQSAIGQFDLDKIEKIVYNLLSNALKHTLSGGSISLSLQVIDHKIELNNTRELQISVSDNGEGIPEKDLPYIFDRFYQSSNGNSSNGSSGIGLFFVKYMVDILKGHIKVSSQTGEGTTFLIRLPFKQSDSVNNKPTNLSRPPIHRDNGPVVIKTEKTNLNDSNKPVVLIVDDSNDIRIHIKDVLGDGFNYHEAENGDLGLSLAQTYIPDIIICDIMMPGKNGFEVCKALKEDERTCHIPLILLTAMGSIDKQTAGLDTGADDYIVKPFNTRLLKTRIRNLLKSRKQLREAFGNSLDINTSTTGISKKDDAFINKAIELIRNNLSDPELCPEKLIKDSGMSQSQFYRKIKALTGQSVSLFIRDIRLKHAANLLQEHRGDVAQVAYDVGFNDAAYFSRCFKEKFGVSPTQYLGELK